MATSDFVVKDGSEAARQKMNSLLNQNGPASPATVPSQHKRKRSETGQNASEMRGILKIKKANETLAF